MICNHFDTKSIERKRKKMTNGFKPRSFGMAQKTIFEQVTPQGEKIFVNHTSNRRYYLKYMRNNTRASQKIVPFKKEVKDLGASGLCL
jgi:hypothetical protein